MATGPDDVLHRELAQKHLGRAARQQLAVPHPAVAADDLVAALRRGVVVGGVGRLAGGVGLGHRPAHAGAAERLVAVEVARPAGAAADVAAELGARPGHLLHPGRGGSALRRRAGRQHDFARWNAHTDGCVRSDVACRCEQCASVKRQLDECTIRVHPREGSIEDAAKSDGFT